MLPPKETDSVFGIHVAVMTGEPRLLGPTRFEQLTAPDEKDATSSPDTNTDEMLVNDCEWKDNKSAADEEAMPLSPSGQLNDAKLRS
jgi:hypothetical protein